MEKTGNINIRGSIFVYNLQLGQENLVVMFEEKETGKK